MIDLLNKTRLNQKQNWGIFELSNEQNENMENILNKTRVWTNKIQILMSEDFKYTCTLTLNCFVLNEFFWVKLKTLKVNDKGAKTLLNNLGDNNNS